ncbi:MAG: hydroxysqualene dehydroxylase HpnE [Firmicutes bacterium]|nr:hydroxysqualene dehydroxylase HpnE [Bacillota bacterium]
MKPSVLILGGGLSGIAAATILAREGYSVQLVERHRYLGGRASGFRDGENWIDNCQHVVLGCCSAFLDLFEKLKIKRLIAFHSSIPFLANGKTTVLAPSKLPSPFHFLPRFLTAPLFSPQEKWSILSLFARLSFARNNPEVLDKINMMDWLKKMKQPFSVIERFWKIILISSLNETLENMSAKYGVMVLEKAFLQSPDSAAVGLPSVPLISLYEEAEKTLLGDLGVKKIKGTVKQIVLSEDKPAVILDDETKLTADDLISALPFYNLFPVLPLNLQEDRLFSNFKKLETTPILGIHFWFDQKITEERFGAFPGSPVHWFFANSFDQRFYYVQLVISAAYEFLKANNSDIIEMGIQELHKYLPDSKKAKLVKSVLVRETRATFSIKPDTDPLRPSQKTKIPHFFLAGDWTDTGWPATMEGAVQSGYRCAEFILEQKGFQKKILK